MSQFRNVEGLSNRYGDDGYLPPEFVRPDNFEEELSPILDIDEEPLVLEQSGVDPNLPRFLFSPMRDLVTRHELCGYDVIFGCTITMLKRVAYVGQNYASERFSDDTRVAKGVPETRVYERMAIYVAAGLIEEYGGIAGAGAPTGVVLLNSLFGLEPQYTYQGMRIGHAEDSRLIVDIQKTLLPYKPKTGADQTKWLISRQAELDNLPDDQPASPRLKKDGRVLSVREVYTGVLSEMIASTETAQNYADVHIEQVKFELNERALGHQGYKGRLNKVDRIVCDWAGQPYPEISGRLKQDEKAPQVIVQQAPQQPFDPNLIASIAASVVAALKDTGVLGAHAAPEPVKDHESEQLSSERSAQPAEAEKQEVIASQSPAQSGQQSNKPVSNSSQAQQPRPGSQLRNPQNRR